MSVRPARVACVPVEESTGAPARSQAGLDAGRDFELYRGPACKRFIAMARAVGHHAFHDLDELAADFYGEFWLEWMERPDRQFSGSPTAYIAGAMMNKLRDLSRRGRSVRSPQIAREDADAILMTVAATELEPAEQVVLQEEMWLAAEIVRSLPAREQVAFGAVFGRDSRRKDAPPAGYKLAAEKLGCSEVRAKKLSLAANKRIRAAVEQIQSGSWCERWAETIELVAAGGESNPEFRAHAEHCTQCRLGVVHLRRQAALLPLPALPVADHAHLIPRLWDHVRSVVNTARHQLTNLFARHAPAANDATGLAGASGGAAGVGATAAKLTVVCLGLGVAGGATTVCLQAVGVPNPVLNALVGSQPAHARVHHRAKVHRPPARSAQVAAPILKPLPIASSPTRTTTSTPTSRPRHVTHTHVSSAAASVKRTVTEAQNEFAPGGGFGTQQPTSGGSGGTSSTSTKAATTSSASTSTPSSSTSTSSSGGGSRGSVTHGSSNDLTAP